MKILDTTIRDGSYAVDFKFSLGDVSETMSKLEKLGLDYIEIGHGMGLGASSIQNGISLHSDIEYMDVARESLSKTPFGFFCIPNIAGKEDLLTAKEHGVSFVRIGINATKFDEALPYIEYASDIGLTVMCNFMKSYIVSPDNLARNAKKAKHCGAEYVYIVDSSGGMMPDMIKNYYDTIRETSDVKIGFHGHNNLGLAVSNTVYCAQLGFDIVDCTFQGLGRSLGNASTEMVVMALKKMGYDIDIDIPRLLEYGYVFIRDINRNPVINPLELICGYADFHSSYIKHIYKCSIEMQVDPLRLILAYSQYDKVGLDYDKLCEIAKTLPLDTEKNPYKFINYDDRNLI